jgi:ABC-type branched-subunit amino acid transport system substrate-binding protein
MKIKYTFRLYLIACSSLIFTNSGIRAGDNEIVFGQSAALSGHLGIYGDFIKNAINASFNRINETGGINGKKLKLISLDDAGDPVQTKHNIKHMLKDQ